MKWTGLLILLVCTGAAEALQGVTGGRHAKSSLVRKCASEMSPQGKNPCPYVSWKGAREMMHILLMQEQLPMSLA